MQRHLPQNARNTHLPFVGKNPVHIQRQIVGHRITDGADRDRRNPIRSRFQQNLKTFHLHSVRPLAQCRFSSALPTTRTELKNCSTTVAAHSSANESRAALLCKRLLLESVSSFSVRMERAAKTWPMRYSGFSAPANPDETQR